MAQYTFHADAASDLTLNINASAGDVRIQGVDDDKLEIEGDTQIERYLRQDGNSFTITGYPTGLRIRLPHRSSVNAKGVGAGVEARAVGQGEGVTFTCSGVGGSVSLEDVPRVDLDGIGGHVRIKGEVQSVKAGQVGGHLEIERAEFVSFRAVGGHAKLGVVERLGGMGNVGGHLSVELTGDLENDLRANVGGNAELVPPDTWNVTLTALVGGRVTGGGEGWSVEGSTGSHTFVFGDGSKKLALTVGGNLEIKGGSEMKYNGSQDWGEWNRNFEGLGEEMRGLGRDMEDLGRTLARDLGTLGRDIAREVRIAGREAMRGVNQREPGTRSRGPRVSIRVNEHDVTLEPEQIERIKREARAAAASGVARAQEAVERALRQWEQRAPRPGRPVPPVPPVPPAAPHAPFTGQTVRIDREEASSVTPMSEAPTTSRPEPTAAEATRDLDAERLAILRMVHEGRIAPDEAEVLLRGLEERG